MRICKLVRLFLGKKKQMSKEFEMNLHCFHNGTRNQHTQQRKRFHWLMRQLLRLHCEAGCRNTFMVGDNHKIYFSSVSSRWRHALQERDIPFFIIQSDCPSPYSRKSVVISSPESVYTLTLIFLNIKLNINASMYTSPSSLHLRFPNQIYVSSYFPNVCYVPHPGHT